MTAYKNNFCESNNIFKGFDLVHFKVPRSQTENV